MDLIQVTNRQQEIEFLDVHYQINKGNPGWIRPLDKDIRTVFDPLQNKAFRHGEAIRWLLQTSSGKTIGRIAAFVNQRYRNKGDDVRVGGIGFFDYIDDQQAANSLFDGARQWLQERGMEAMDGPINFGERDKWWGLLVEGFESPLYTMNYNPPYYQQLFDTYGFKNFYNQLCWKMAVASESAQLDPKFYKAHLTFADNPDVRAERSYFPDATGGGSAGYGCHHRGVSELAVCQGSRRWATVGPGGRL